MKVTSKVGPLRGGTPMVNLNTIIREHTQMPLKDLIPQGREIWVGFARAHFVECGCGKDFYRPNLVVIVKDPASNEDAKHHDMYRISHISSFTSLDVEAISWDPLRPLDLCVGTNAIIPNGISEWTAHNFKSTGKAWKVDDMLTLSLSVSDCTIDVVHVKGLLNTLMNLPDRLFNLPPSKEGQDSDSPADVATENALFP
ncbi:hypothetical protein JCM33374_g3691 [Metschnikowia sp. JCM 33374]|nr:hypothetical protein JCM33374_g3691 [Metschnikowia sp. JCM 33374]